MTFPTITHSASIPLQMDGEIVVSAIQPPSGPEHFRFIINVPTLDIISLDMTKEEMAAVESAIMQIRLRDR